MSEEYKSASRLKTTPGVFGVSAMALLLLSLASCSSPKPASIAVLTQRCLDINGAGPVHLQLRAPARGVLRVAIEQYGISTVGLLTSSNQRSPIATSPADRYGMMTLLAAARAKQIFSVRVSSRDSHEMTGEVCIGAQLLSSAEPGRVAAEQAHAQGAQEAYRHNWRDAYRHYAAAARRFDQLGLQALAQAARYSLAHLAYHRLMNPRDAMALAGMVLAAQGVHTDPGLRSSVLALQALLVLEAQSSDPDASRWRALRLLDHATALAGRTRFGAREMPRLEILRGFVHYISGDVPAGIRAMERAAPRCAALRDWECYAHAKQNLGAMSLDADDYQVAETHFADALRNLDPTLAPKLAAEILANFGLTSGLRGQYAQSERSLRRAAHLYIQLKDCDGVRYTFARLGAFLAQVGRTEDAYPYLQHAAATGCTDLLALTDFALEPSSAAAILARIEASPTHTMHDGAASPVIECKSLHPQDAPSADGQFAVYLALYALGEALLTEGHLDDAERCIQVAQSFTTSARQELNLANLRGRALLRRGDPARAKAVFQKAIEVADAAGIAKTHEYLDHAREGLASAALMSRDISSARTHALHMLKNSSARGDVAQVISALQLLSEQLQEAGENNAAQGMLRAAIELSARVPVTELNGERRAAYMATQHALFAQLTEILSQEALAHSGTIWDAFKAAELGRARSLRFLLQQAALERAALMTQPTSATYIAMIRRIAELTRTHQDLKLRDALVGELVKLAKDTQTDPPIVDARQLVEHLTALDATLIAYRAGRKDMFAFVIDRQAMQLIRLTSLASIAQASRELQVALRAPEINAASVQRTARTLAEQILWPLGHLVSERRIIVIPDDALHTVPFAVLPWSRAPGDTLLLHHAETTIAPSAAFLIQKSRHDASGTRFLSLIGEPILQKEQWWRECMRRTPADSASDARPASAHSLWLRSLPALPGTGREVIAISALAQRLHSAKTIGLHTGCAATKSALFAAIDSGPEILHIATHGYVDSSRPRLSALALTPESAQDPQPGLFYLSDILESRVRTPLVVLSACDSSRGKVFAGEGALSPAQAFLHAGAASVLASYWRISDKDTAAFMHSFYRYLLEQKLTAGMALRSAQLEHATEHSYHWAAFALHGLPDVAIRELNRGS